MPQVASTLQERLDKDLYRREGKGRRCRLGDRIASIPCHASCFAPEWYEEKDEFILFVVNGFILRWSFGLQYIFRENCEP